MIVVMRSIVGFTAIRCGLQLGGERGCPFFPGEVPGLGKLDGERERLRLPRLGEDGPAFVAREARQRGEAIGF